MSKRRRHRKRRWRNQPLRRIMKMGDRGSSWFRSMNVRVSSWFRSLADRVRRRFKKIFWNTKLSKIYFRTLERITSLFSAVGLGLGYVWHLILSLTVQSSVVESIRQKSRQTAKKINRSWGQVADEWIAKAESSVFTWWLAKLAKFAVGLISSVSTFWAHWMWSRNFWLLIGAIPALLLILPVGLFLARIPLQTDDKTTAIYQRAVTKAIEEDDFDAVALYTRRIAQLGNQQRARLAYRAALQLEEKGKIDEAYAQMQRLAKPNEPGFTPAHIWIATRLAAGEIESEGTTDNQSLIISHIEQAIKLQPDDPRLSLMLADANFVAGNGEKTRQILDAIVEKLRDPINQVRAARLYQQLGEPDAAQHLLANAEAIADDSERFGSDFAPSHFIGKAEAEFARGKLAEAIETTKRGLAEHPDNEALKRLSVMLRIHDFDLTRQFLSPLHQLEVLSELNALVPHNPDVLQRMSQLMAIETTKESAEAALLAAADEQDTDGYAHKLLGSAYANQGRYSESREFFEKAIAAQPESHEIMNNLAWLYLKFPPTDLKKSLKMAREAVDRDPTNPHYRDTLGQVYMALNRWELAVEQLSAAVNGLPTSRGTHESLAKCYEMLNQPELATRHRTFAEQ